MAAVKRAVDAERPAMMQRLRAGLKVTLSAAMELRQPGARRPVEEWRTFLPNGTQLPQQPGGALLAALQEHGAVYVFEGGVFVWPGIRRGFERTLHMNAGGTVVMTTLSLQPLVFSLDGLLSDEQCSWIVDQGKAHMRPHPKGLMAPRQIAITTGASAGQGDAPDKRLADMTQALLVVDATARAIERLAQEISRAPEMHGEPMHVLQYEQHHRYDAHLDSFENASRYHAKSKILAQIEGGRNRLSTLLVYLEAPGGGGETLFPRAGGLPFKKKGLTSYECSPESSGLRILPKRKHAILFYNLRADGEQDKLSLHCGCPPRENGTKWVANLWTWNKPYI